MTLLGAAGYVKSFRHLCPRGHRDTSSADSRIGVRPGTLPPRQARNVVNPTTLSKVVGMSCAGNHEESRASADDPAFRDYVLTRGSALLRMATIPTGNRAGAEDLV